MGFIKFKADRLFDGYHFLDDTNVLITDENGKVKEIIRSENAGEDVRTYNGILSPGFVNCHCHLELSHLKNIIPPHTGLIEFLLSVVQKRGFEASVIQENIVAAEKEMYDNGIVAIGDISNTADSIDVKNKSKIRWQNFIEMLSPIDKNAKNDFVFYTKVAEQFKLKTGKHDRSILTAHAPYTVSASAFNLINESTAGKLISVHNQEHPAEDELFQTGGGDFLNLLAFFGLGHSPFAITGKSSLRSWLPYFNHEQKILLVHNTSTAKEDLQFANRYAEEKNIEVIYCLCPQSNQYIENVLPDVPRFMEQNCTIVLGTDSYSSNWQLSIVKEMQAIHKFFPHISLDNLFRWATLNGATALNWQHELGSFEKNKTPGIVLTDEKLSISQRIL